MTGAARAFMQHGTTWQLLGFRLHVGFLDASNNLLMVVENNLLGTCTDFHLILMDGTEVFILLSEIIYKTAIFSFGNYL